MRSLVTLAAFVASVGFAIPAAADPAYTARDIVNHFTVEPSMGATRGICIGTETECGTPQPDGMSRVGFDLLITFDMDSATLTPEAKENLDEFAKALKDPKLSAANFEVDGHTDAYGGEDYNMELSERRAEAVIQYLSGLGVDTSNLTPKGFGKTQPRAADPYDAVNRRVETRLVQ
jgi:outer membrane protein OmpA-like peptidoglycan-associated protein